MAMEKEQPEAFLELLEDFSTKLLALIELLPCAAVCMPPCSVQSEVAASGQGKTPDLEPGVLRSPDR